jgi:hypothetical protein
MEETGMKESRILRMKTNRMPSGLFRVAFRDGDDDVYDPGFLIFAASFEEALALVRKNFSYQFDTMGWRIHSIKARRYSDIIVSDDAILATEFDPCLDEHP